EVLRDAAVVLPPCGDLALGDDPVPRVIVEDAGPREAVLALPLAQRRLRVRAEDPVRGDADDPLGQLDVRSAGALAQRRVAVRRQHRHARPTGGRGHVLPRLAGPPGGALHRTVPAEAEVDVVGVRARAVVGPPAVTHLVRAPDLAVP